MHYVPQSESCPLPGSLFKSCAVPRPIGRVSTISKNGTTDRVPFSQWTNLAFDPPAMIFPANQLFSGESAYTVVITKETGWFVWNMATCDLREAVNIFLMAVPKREDEFQHAAVKAQPCISAPNPRVYEMQIPVGKEAKHQGLESKSSLMTRFF